ncbi:MAG: YbaN family protein [Pseudomonadota bacterium]
MSHYGRTLAKPLLICVGSVATLLAIIGAVLPGLPTTPFLLVALWAFARSSQRLHDWLTRIPILKTALVEAKRFEERRAMRPAVKIGAFLMAWLSVLVTVYASGSWLSTLSLVVAAAAVAGTLVVILVPTDRS